MGTWFYVDDYLAWVLLPYWIGRWSYHYRPQYDLFTIPEFTGRFF